MKKLLIALAVVSLFATVATAEVIWDQSEFDTGYSMWHSESGCGPFSGATIHLANDIQIYDQVTVNQITTYYTMGAHPMDYVTEAYLYIGLKTGSLPVDGVDEVHDDSLLVPVTIATVDPGNGGSWYYTVVASDLDISLAPGEYWVSMTPANYDVGPAGPNYHYAAINIWGDDVAGNEYCSTMSPPAWANYHPGRDASMLVEGTIDVVATEGQNWGTLKALYR